MSAFGYGAGVLRFARSPEVTDEASPPARSAVPPALDRAAGLSWRFLVVAVAVTALGYLLLRLRLVVVPVFVGLLLATLLVPPVRWLRDAKGWPPLLATWSVLLGALAVVGGALVALVPELVDQFGQLGPRLEEAGADIESWLVDGPLGLSQDQIDRYVDSAIDQVRSNGSAITSGVVTGAYLAAELVAGTLLAMVLAFFFTKDGDRISAWMTRQVAPERRPLARALGRRAWSTLAAYVRGTALVGLVDAVIIGVGLVLIGVPLVLPLAALTFLGAFFPLIGATLAGAVAALVALVSGGPGDALLVLAVVVVVQQVEGDVLAPLVMGRALRLHPVVILVVLTIGAVLAGLLGAFLAVPFTAVGAAVVNEARTQGTGAGDPPAQPPPSPSPA